MPEGCTRPVHSCDSCGDQAWIGGDGEWQGQWFCQSCWEQWDLMDQERKEHEQWRREQEEGDAAPQEPQGQPQVGEDEAQEGLGFDFDLDDAADGMDDMDFEAYAAWLEYEEADPHLEAAIEATLEIPLPMKVDNTEYEGVWQCEPGWWRAWRPQQGEGTSENTEDEADAVDPPDAAEAEIASVPDSAAPVAEVDSDLEEAMQLEAALRMSLGLPLEEEGGSGSAPEYASMVGIDEVIALPDAPERMAAAAESVQESPISSTGPEHPGVLHFTIGGSSSSSSPAPSLHGSLPVDINEVLQASARAADCDAIQIAIEAAADVNCRDELKNTPLLLVAANATLGAGAQALTVLLESSASIDLANDLGETPLLVAAARADAAMVDTLLRWGADPNCESILLERPLTVAANAQDVDSVKLLLRHRACITEAAQASIAACPAACRDREVREALRSSHLAAARVASAATAASASAASSFATSQDGLLFPDSVWRGDAQAVSIRAEERRRALEEMWYAIEEMDANALRSMTSTDCSFVNSRRFDGNTPLLVAANRSLPSTLGKPGRCTEIIEVLLARRADPSLRNVLGETPLQILARVNDTASMEVLLRNGADPDHKDRFQDTALREAIITGSEEVVMTLVRSRASVREDDRRKAHAEAKADGDQTNPVFRAIHREATAQRYDAFFPKDPDPEIVRGFAPVPGETAVEEARREKAAILRAAQVDREYFNVRHPPRVSPTVWNCNVVEQEAEE